MTATCRDTADWVYSSRSAAALKEPVRATSSTTRRPTRVSSDIPRAYAEVCLMRIADISNSRLCDTSERIRLVNSTNREQTMEMKCHAPPLHAR